jgi:hypothetical protein
MDRFFKFSREAKKNILFFTLVIKKPKPEEGPNSHLKQTLGEANW